jgi:predicted HTH transcriptional regulator
MMHLEYTKIPIDILEEIIALGKGYKTEFHKKLPSMTRIAQTICAFSNTKGGNLFIGISDNGDTVPINDKYTEVEKIERAITLMIPKPNVSVQTVEFKRDELIIVKVGESENKPCYVTLEAHKTAYVRTGDKNIPASKKALKTFIKNSSKTKKRKTR